MELEVMRGYNGPVQNYTNPQTPLAQLKKDFEEETGLTFPYNDIPEENQRNYLEDLLVTVRELQFPFEIKEDLKKEIVQDVCEAAFNVSNDYNEHVRDTLIDQLNYYNHDHVYE